MEANLAIYVEKNIPLMQNTWLAWWTVNRYQFWQLKNRSFDQDICQIRGYVLDWTNKPLLEFWHVLHWKVVWTYTENITYTILIWSVKWESKPFNKGYFQFILIVGVVFDNCIQPMHIVFCKFDFSLGEHYYFNVLLSCLVHTKRVSHVFEIVSQKYQRKIHKRFINVLSMLCRPLNSISCLIRRTLLRHFKPYAHDYPRLKWATLTLENPTVQTNFWWAADSIFSSIRLETMGASREYGALWKCMGQRFVSLLGTFKMKCTMEIYAFKMALSTL